MTQLGIIGGYLGSGKTTLVNYLLDGILPGRTAIIVNDFGSVNIDASLIASLSADTIELTNGCICCQITDDFAQTIAPLAQRSDIDNVLCEVSGVGDPRDLGSWRSFPGFSPGPLLVCADVTSLQKRLNDPYVGDVVESQIRSAEVILLTKTDLAPESLTEEIERTCRRLASQAQIVVPDGEGLSSSLQEIFSGGSAAAARLAGQQSAATAESVSDHGTVHQTKTVDDLPRCDAAQLQSVLENYRGRIQRAKGFFQDSAGQWHRIDLSGDHIVVEGLLGSSLPQRGSVVLIASGPDAHKTLQSAAADIHAIKEKAQRTSSRREQ